MSDSNNIEQIREGDPNDTQWIEEEYIRAIQASNKWYEDYKPKRRELYEFWEHRYDIHPQRDIVMNRLVTIYDSNRAILIEEFHNSYRK